MRAVDYRALVRKVELISRGIGAGKDGHPSVVAVAAEIVSRFREDLGLLVEAHEGESAHALEEHVERPRGVLPALEVESPMQHVRHVFRCVDLDPVLEAGLRQSGAREEKQDRREDAHVEDDSMPCRGL